MHSQSRPYSRDCLYATAFHPRLCRLCGLLLPRSATNSGAARPADRKAAGSESTARHDPHDPPPPLLKPLCREGLQPDRRFVRFVLLRSAIPSCEKRNRRDGAADSAENVWQNSLAPHFITNGATFPIGSACGRSFARHEESFAPEVVKRIFFVYLGNNCPVKPSLQWKTRPV